MAVKFFGQYLLEAGVLSPEQLMACVELQNRTNRSEAEYAVQLGYVSKDEADRIEISRVNIEDSFGDVAVSLGLLTKEQVGQVLALQRKQRMRLGEAAIVLGHADEEVIHEHANQFERDQAPFEATTIVLDPSVPFPDYVTSSIDLTEKMLLRMVRIFGRRGHITPIDSSKPDDSLLTVGIRYSGAFNGEYQLSASPNMAREIARRLIGNGHESPGDFAVDGLAEVCNTVCGNVCAKLDDRGVEAQISPPIFDSRLLSQELHGVLVPIDFPEGRFEVRVGVDAEELEVKDAS